MSQTTKLFADGRSHAVRQPAEAFINQHPVCGDVILSDKPDAWRSFFAALQDAAAPADFLARQERGRQPAQRDPLKGWHG